MALNHQKFKELLGLFKQRYPNWISFSDPPDSDFQKDEIDYKQRLVLTAANQLAKPDMAELIDAEDYDALLTRIQNVAKDRNNNLLFLRFPSSGDLSILEHPDLDKPAFAHAFF
jgi:5-methylcytosine-specific restriction enzyme B